MTFPVDPNRSAPSAPWGVAPTLAWLVSSFLISALAATVFFAAFRIDSSRMNTGYDGVIIAIGALTSVPVQIGVLAWAARLRGWSPMNYFALNAPRRGEVIIAVVSVVTINLAFNALLYLTGRDIVAPFQVEAYQSAQNAGWLFWLLVAIIVAAPLGEEIAFRGFLFRGLVRPGWEMHAIGAISLAWALLHIQYDWLGMAQIFALGLVLGWFRWASGSTTLTIIMHMLINLEAMIETAIKVEYLT
jgi:membrane protease YdiL (CAAX protease family)